MTLPIDAVFGQQLPEDVKVQIASKHYSSGYLPMTGSYVEYEVRLKNEGHLALENQTLRISLISGNDRVHSSAAYSVPLLNPGNSKTLYLGPFRMEDEGDYRLLAEINGIALDYNPDLFTAYRQEAIQAAFIAIPLIAAGAGLVGFSLYCRKAV